MPTSLRPLVEAIEQEGGKARAFGSDARKEEEMIALIDTIEREVGAIEAAVYNIGANVRFPIRETTSRVFFKVWEMACFGGFLMGREVAKRMVPRGRGTILFTGATASVRGGSGYAAFASGKHALRALAQSMARELGPEGIHVAHVVIDGAIDTAWIRENFPERAALKDEDGILSRRRSPRTTGCCIPSRAAPGPTSSICGLGSRSGSGDAVGRAKRAARARHRCCGGHVAARFARPTDFAKGGTHVDCRSRTRPCANLPKPRTPGRSRRRGRSSRG